MNFLKKALNTTAVLAVTAGVAFTAIDAKAEDAGTNITATVQNAITWVETQPLQFGTFVAIADATDTSTLAIDVAGASTITNPGNPTHGVRTRITTQKRASRSCKRIRCTHAAAWRGGEYQRGVDC